VDARGQNGKRYDSRIVAFAASAAAYRGVAMVPNSSQHLARNAQGLAGQQGELGIRKGKRTSLEPLAQHAVLSLQILDDDRLLAASIKIRNASGKGLSFMRKGL
jgi:hypothetical protein